MRRGVKATGLAGLVAGALLLAGCEAPVRNAVLAKDAKVGLGAETGYRLDLVRAGETEESRRTLIIASFSGGGTRAAALAAGALHALAKTDWTETQRKLADEVDIVSSVSGGSVTAAHFALFGAVGLERLDKEFIRRNIIWDIVVSALRPDHLIELPTPKRARIDWLIDVFRERLFSEPGGEPIRFRRLRDRKWLAEQQGPGLRERIPPYLILNAGDMGGGTVFPFTQEWFDFLCSDLEALRIADAVAASAAFPIALTPVTLKNHTHRPGGCEAHKAAAFWPPPVVTGALASGLYREPGLHRRAAVQNRFLETGEDAKKFVHLLDGGIADNLGIAEPLHFLSAATTDGRLQQAILNRKITRIIWVIVNARAEEVSSIDGSDSTPGILSQFSAVTGASIDNASFSRIYRLRSTLRDVLTRDLQNQLDQAQREKRIDEEFFQELKKKRDAVRQSLKIGILPVDFDFVKPPDCRKTLKGIETWWNLPDEEIDLLYAVGEALVYRAPDYARLFAEGAITPPSGVAEILAPMRAAGEPGELYRRAEQVGAPLIERACRQAKKK